MLACVYSSEPTSIDLLAGELKQCELVKDDVPLGEMGDFSSSSMQP